MLLLRAYVKDKHFHLGLKRTKINLNASVQCNYQIVEENENTYAEYFTTFDEQGVSEKKFIISLFNNSPDSRTNDLMF